MEIVHELPNEEQGSVLWQYKAADHDYYNQPTTAFQNPLIDISDSNDDASCDGHVITANSCEVHSSLSDKDVFAFALQIARGMEHLEKMKVRSIKITLLHML